MKLIEDDGSVIEEIDDDATLMVFEAGRAMPTLITPKMDRKAPVPRHILLAGAVLAYLDHPYNREKVMEYLPNPKEGKN